MIRPKSPRWSQEQLDSARHTAGGCVSVHFKEPAKPRKSRPSKPAGPSERQSQAAVCDWWRAYCGTVGLDERLLMASASGAVLAGDGKQRAIQMHSMKKTGFRVGVPDLFLALPTATQQHNRVTIFHGCFIEMKSATGRTNPAQLEYADLLRRQGYNCCIVWSAEEAITAIKSYCERALP